MKFYFTLGFFSVLLFLHDATAFPGIGRRFFRRSPENHDTIPTSGEYSVDAGLRGAEMNAEHHPNSDRVLNVNDIPPTILRKFKQQYGRDIDAETLAEIINRNPQLASQLDSLGALDTRGKFKKLTGIAFLLALLKIIF